MLEDLRTYENLGTPQYFFELFNSLNKNSEVIWTKKDVQQLFYNKIINGRSVFDGCLYLANKLEIVNIDEKGIVSLTGTIKDFLFSEKQMCDKFVEALFLALRDNSDFHSIFSSKNISYDIIYHSIQISNSAFGLKHSKFKQLLIDFDIIKIHPTEELRKFILNSRYKKLFDKTVLPEIKKRKLGINELKQLLEQQQIYGEEAERYVLNLEIERLDNKQGIDWVAEYSIAEGYDISSFEAKESLLNDRFIEVKSYSGNPYFFWSRNEVDIARIKGESYFLYLVDRSQIHNLDYKPLMIRNPYKSVLQNNHWEKQVEKYKIELKGNFDNLLVEINQGQ